MEEGEKDDEGVDDNVCYACLVEGVESMKELRGCRAPGGSRVLAGGLCTRLHRRA